MKNNDYLIVHKSILPSFFEQVIMTREIINNQKIKISDACKMQKISRSTYYKYKDYIYRPTRNQGSKALFAIKTIDEKGILSSLLQIIYSSRGNVISINQDAPIGQNAFITIMLDVSELEVNLDTLKKFLASCDGVKEVDIMGVE